MIVGDGALRFDGTLAELAETDGGLEAAFLRLTAIGDPR